ncbi:FHA domain-containing protein [Humisphaera borealis]|uniref:FHA domain-containing protein n=1 Tax=Humisphaera borealis TaxID=2807512 RepID=A0A7M2WX29_9BACT|nr:FHA domain-containing protein [Humisphaera borealis]QOV90087.1 FHA domain-containing protein [Humisphaera borealis]
MGLQIRVRHALGERVLELPDRTVDEPVVVGRASSAEVQVPWVTVAPKHCVLFIHEGHWAVQDLGAGAGTFVNREQVVGARLLQIGDMIQVGPEAGAPTIEVDPAAAAEGRTGYAGTGLPHMQQQAVASGYGSYQASGSYGRPGYAGAYNGGHHGSHGEAPPQYAPAVAEAPASSDEISFAAASTPTYSSYRKPRSNNGGMITVMVIAVILIGGFVGFVLYRQSNEPKVIVQKQPDVTIVKSSKQQGLFEGLNTSDTTLDNLGQKGKNPKNTVAAVPSGTKPKGSATVDPRKENPNSTPSSTDRPPRPLESQTVTPGMEPKEPPKKTTEEPGMDPIKKPAAGTGAEPGMDPIKKPAAGDTEPGMDPIKKPEPAKPTGPDAENLDPAMAASWDAMKTLAENPGKESFAVLRFEDFRRLNPGKFDKELDEFIDRKMDRIWWERIDQLFRKIKKLGTDIDKTQNEVFDENNLDIKKQKLAAIKTMKSDLETSTKTLRENMGYGEAEPPNLSSSAELTALAQKRDKGKYEGWKKATLFYIKSNQGRLQWMNEI